MLEQHKSYCGDSISWQSDYTDYPSTTWSLTAYLNGPRNLAVSGSASGTGYEIFVTAAQTAALPPGTYTITEVVTSGASRATVSTITVELLQDPATLPAGYDNRSHVKKVFDAIKAVIENRATQAEEKITIAGRSLDRTPMKDLIVLYKQYESMVKAEEAAENISNNMGSGNSVYVRWGSN